jgi:hypothetical protein
MRDISRPFSILESVDRFDVLDNYKNAAREHEEETDDAQDANGVEPNKDICLTREPKRDESNREYPQLRIESILEIVVCIF